MKNMANKVLLLIFSGCLYVAVFGQRFPSIGRRMRCPDGTVSFRTCNGFDPRSCFPPNRFFCFAPADAGVCCRREPINRPRCPRPSRRPCFGLRPRQRRCIRDRDCFLREICCRGPCGRVCTRSRRY